MIRRGIMMNGGRKCIRRIRRGLHKFKAGIAKCQCAISTIYVSYFWLFCRDCTLTVPVGSPIRCVPQILVALPATARGAVVALWADHRDGAFLEIGCAARRSAPSMPASGPTKPPVRLTQPSACYGWNRWKALAARRSHRRPSRNASTAVTAGLRSCASDARRVSAYRSTRSAARATRPIWKLEAALKCRSCRTPRHSPPVHMIKLTKEREITPYAWVHPDDDERR
jgi:hypothetical protein